MQSITQYTHRKIFVVAFILLSSIFFRENVEAVSVGWSVVIDDLDPGYSETGNAWASYTYPAAINGRYRYLSHMKHTVERKGTARWQTGIPASGKYRVEIHYRPTENRTRDADFFVYDGKGSVHHYSVDQTYGGPLSSTGWLTLGNFSWSAKQTAKVVLDGTDSNDSDEADAVRWTLIEKTGGVEPYVPIAVLQRLLLNKPTTAGNSVNLAGKWLETGGWTECFNTGTSTRLEATITYANGKYTFVKNGRVQKPAPDCGSQTIAPYTKTVAPTSQLVSRSVFTAMMREIFPKVYQIDILYFSKEVITYKIYHIDGIRIRTFTRQ